jgi:predicted 3-demethylubiquinone-9 3-methyltransferase (glyoxalase superfamily)
MQKMQTCLWFDGNAEEATKFYASVFKSSKIGRIARYGEVGQEIHGGKPGTVMTIEFELNGNSYLGLNGGPIFKFNEAISLQVLCETQEEIDYYWEKLTPGGDPASQQCGWLKDKFGLSWQIVPAILGDLMAGGDQARADRVMGAVLSMKKLDIKKLKEAAGR